MLLRGVGNLHHQMNSLAFLVAETSAKDDILHTVHDARHVRVEANEWSSFLTDDQFFVSVLHLLHIEVVVPPNL